MKKVRLFCRTAHVYGYYKRKTSFDLHNFRREDRKPEEDKNYTEELSANNCYYKDGKRLHIEQAESVLRGIEQDCKDKTKSLKNGISNERLGALNLKRSKTKAKLKKWAENSKNEDAEKDFFQVLLEKVGNKKINANEELEKLSSLGKIKRFNDKKKAIDTLEECNELLDVKHNKSLSMKIISTEKIFKIPDQHGVNVDPDDWNKLINDFHNKYYKDYDHYYTAVHLDEKKENPHAHHRFSGFNNKTKQFDLPDHELNLLRKICDKPLFDNKKYSQLNSREVKKFGELYQFFVFKFCNNHLSKKYNLNFEKRTQEEKEADQHKYSNSSIRSRAFNGVNKAKEEKKLLEDQSLKLDAENSEKIEQGLKLDAENSEKAEENQELKKEGLKLKKWFKTKFSVWCDKIISFKNQELEKDLIEAVDMHNQAESFTSSKNDALTKIDDQIEKHLNKKQAEKYQTTKNLRKNKGLRP